MTKYRKKKLKRMYESIRFKPNFTRKYRLVPIVFQNDSHIYWRIVYGNWQQLLYSSLRAAYDDAKRMKSPADDIVIQPKHCMRLKHCMQSKPVKRRGWELTA